MPSTFLYETPLVEVRAVESAFGPTTGATAIAILGRGFVAGATVVIGGNPATSVNVISDERITAVTPAHISGAVDVTVTNVDTSTDTLEDGYTYYIAPSSYDVAYRKFGGATGSRIRTENSAPSIHKQMGQPDSMSFTATDQPEGLEFVQFRTFGIDLFMGVAVRVSERVEGKPLVSCWDTEATGLEHELAGEHPVAAFTNIPGDAALQQLMFQYAPGFSTSGVESGLDPITAIFDGSLDLWSAIMQICDLCGAKCFLAGTTLHAFTDDPFYDPPADVTPTNPDLIWPDGGDPVTIEYDYSQIVNSVTARGAEDLKVERDNPASIRLYRRRKGWINNNELTTVEELGQAVQNMLDGGAGPIPVVKYSTRDLKTDRGKKVHIAMDQPDIDGDWIIDSVTIDQLDLVLTSPDTPLSVKRRHYPRFKVTAKPAWVSMRQRRMSTVEGVIQSVIDLNTNAKKSPKLDGDVTSDPGGRVVIQTITNEQIAGCITNDKLQPAAMKDPVVTVTTTQQTLTGSGFDINGRTVVAGDRVLVAAQDDSAENGIYVVGSGSPATWRRATDSDSSAQLVPGVMVTVNDGDLFGNTYVLQSTSPVEVGTTPLSFIKIGGPGSSSSQTVVIWPEDPGSDDSIGIPGPTGPQGLTGAAGSGGSTGPQGPPGFVDDPEEPAIVVGPPGPRGATGSSSSTGDTGDGVDSRYTSEVSSGAIDGVNRTFATAHAYMHLEVFVNGIFQWVGWDYQELSSTQFELTYAPLPASGVTPADVVTTNYDAIVGGTTDPTIDPPTAGDPITATRVFPPRLDVSRPTYFGVVGTGFDGPTTSTTIKVVSQTVSEYVAQGQGGSYRAEPASADTLALAAGTYSVSVSTNRSPNTVMLANSLIVEAWAGNSIKYLEGNNRNVANMDSVEGIILSKSGAGSGPSGMQYVINIWGSGFSNQFFLSANAAVTLGDVSVYLSHLGYNGSGALGSATYDGTLGYIAIDLAGASLGSKNLVISNPIFAAGSVTLVGAITVVP